MTIPIDADDSQIRGLAEHARINRMAGPEDIVLGRNAWDGGEPAFAIANRRGAAEGLPGASIYHQGIAWYIVRSLECFQIFSEVCGPEAMGSRLIRVVGLGGNLGLCAEALASVYHTEQWNPHQQRIDVLMGEPGVKSIARAYGIDWRAG